MERRAQTPPDPEIESDQLMLSHSLDPTPNFDSAAIARRSHALPSFAPANVAENSSARLQLPRTGLAPGPAVSAARGAVMEELVAIIGQDGATRLIAAFGGTRLYVPHFPEPEDPLSRAIGHPEALRLAQVYRGDRIEVPNPTPRRERIVQMRAAGLSVDTIARAVGCTRRRVFQVLAEARRERLRF